MGADAIDVGVVPTPAIAYLTRHLKADAGVVISASHNPMEFNGIKFFNGEGFKLSDSLEDEIEDIIRGGMKKVSFPEGREVGRIFHDENAVEEYITFMEEIMPIDLTGLKIVADCAEGASYVTSPRVLRDLGADVIAIHADPDGTNINLSCGSTHMEELTERVVEEGADVGLAFDGDASTSYSTNSSAFGWVGLDLGEPHVITRVGFTPASGSQGADRISNYKFTLNGQQDLVQFVKGSGIGKASTAQSGCSLSACR